MTRYAMILTILLTASPALAQGVPAISSEDTLRWENLALKMQLHQERVQTIQKDVQAVQAGLEQERKALEDHFQATYKVPLSTLQRRDGKWSVIPPTEKK